MMTHLPATRSSDAPQAFRDAHQRQARGIHVKRDRLRGGIERNLLRRRDLVHLRRHSDLVRVVTLPLCIHRLNLQPSIFIIVRSTFTRRNDMGAKSKACWKPQQTAQNMTKTQSSPVDLPWKQMSDAVGSEKMKNKIKLIPGYIL